MPSRTDLSTPLSGRFWRAGFLAHADQILSTARAPIGRWHHSGQRALYLSGTPEGCKVALRVYLKPNDPPRGIFPIDVRGARIIDLRCKRRQAAFRTSLERMHIAWATMHANDLRPPTWDVSDKIRALGVDGILTPSRSRPELVHLTLFKWNEADAAQIKVGGRPLLW